MSYEDIEDARAKRVVKGEVTVGKGKRGRKRKTPTSIKAKAKKHEVKRKLRKMRLPQEGWKITALFSSFNSAPFDEALESLRRIFGVKLLYKGHNRVV